jgi:hypothetical protein
MRDSNSKNALMAPPAAAPKELAAGGRYLTRHETHDLSMIIKDRTKVLKAHAEEQAALMMADFEQQISAIYAWDKDETWKAAVEEARKTVDEANEKIAARCKKLGIPAVFAPGIGIAWHGRGENAVKDRRHELRTAAKAQVEAMLRAAVTKIEKQALELRTQVVSRGLLSQEAKFFLESMAPIEDAMQSLNLADIEKRLDNERQQRLSHRARFTES